VQHSAFCVPLHAIAINRTDDIWRILEGQDYPRLWRELVDEEAGG
jgi:hypothetical protein